MIGPGIIGAEPAEFVVLADASRTASVNSADIENRGWRGGNFRINIVSQGTGSITATIQGKDVLTGNYYTILASPAMAANAGENILKVYPGLTPSANAVSNDSLPRRFRVSVVANNANAVEYSITVSLLP